MYKQTSFAKWVGTILSVIIIAGLIALALTGALYAWRFFFRALEMMK